MTGVDSSSYSSGTKLGSMACREFMTFGVGCRNLPSERSSCNIDRMELIPMTEQDMRRNEQFGSTSLGKRKLETGLVTAAADALEDAVTRGVTRLIDGTNGWSTGQKKSDLIVFDRRNSRPQNNPYVTELFVEPRGTATHCIQVSQLSSSHLVAARCPKGHETIRSSLCGRNAGQDLVVVGESLHQEASKTGFQRQSSAGSQSCPNLRTLGVRLVDGKDPKPFLKHIQCADDLLSWRERTLPDPNPATISMFRKDPMDYGHYRQHHRCIPMRPSIDAEGSCSMRGERYQMRKTDPYEAIESSDRLPSAFNSEEQTIRRTVQGAATESTPLRLSSTVRPGRPSSRHHRVSDSNKQTAASTVYYQDPSGDGGFTRWVVCIVLGLSLCIFLYLYLSHLLRYQFLVAVVTSSVASPLVAVACLTSKRIRCCGSLAVPTVFVSNQGRIGYLLLVTGILLCGPATNVCENLREISRSFSCGIDQSHNQTMLMTNPYKGLVGQLNVTIVSLQEAVVRAEDDLKPLEERLRQLQHGIQNGLLQLFGSQKACKVFVDRAYGACVNSISKAKLQCLGVLEALANVYKHAQGVLDSLNPDRWAPKSANLAPNRHQILLMGSRGREQMWNEVLSDDSDICEPLHSVIVCQGLNSSETLCRPSGWAGSVIQGAVNSTLTALGQLEGYLRTSVRYGPPLPPSAPHIPMTVLEATVNETKVRGRQSFLEGFDDAVEMAEQSMLLVARVIPVIACVLVGWAASTYLTLYLCVDPTYLPMQWLPEGGQMEWRSYAGQHRPPRPLEQASSFCFERLLPGQSGQSPTDGLFVVALHGTLAGVLTFIDFSLYWVLSLVRMHSRPPFDVTGGNTLSSVVRGNGTLAKILREFLRGFHPGHWFGFYEGGFACMPSPSTPSLVSASVLVVLYGVLVLGVTMKRRSSMLRSAICGRFYQERELARSECLSGIIRAKRTRVLRSIKEASSSSSAETEQKTATCDRDLLRQLIDLHPDNNASGSVCHRILFQRVSLCVICRSSAATQACPCVVCQQQDQTTARVRCCEYCLRAIESNAHSSSLCRDSSSNAYVDLI